MHYKNINIKDLQNENWKDIEGYKNYYQISNLGRVKSLSRRILSKNNSTAIIKDRILKQGNSRGYKRVLLLKNRYRKMMSVHRLVANTFIDNPLNKTQVNHINGVKSDNQLSNLEWVTPSENKIHAFKIGLETPQWKGVYGKENPLSININQFSKDGLFIKTHNGINQASRDLSIDASTIVNVLKGNRKSAGGYKWEYKQ